MADAFIERRIVTGCIVSTDYIREINKLWNPRYAGNPISKKLITWCLDYFRQYNEAPGRNIESIYTRKLKEGLSEEEGEFISGILDSLSEEYEREQFNLQYALDETKLYFKEQHLRNFNSDLDDALRAGDILEAESIAAQFNVAVQEAGACIEPFEKHEYIKQAFTEQSEILVKWPKRLKEFWQDSFARDSFIGLQGPEKSGKTYLLWEIAARSLMNGCKTVFFQAGDMSQNQQLRRMGVWLTKRSDKEKYCRGMYVPVADCEYNQLDTCSRKERESSYGVFDEEDEWNSEKLADISFSVLKKAVEENPDYVPCRNCTYMKGRPWLKWREKVNPLTWQEAYKAARAFRKKYQTRFKLVTYPSESLSLAEIRTYLELWKKEGFIPDVIVIDYADILMPDPDIIRLDERGRTNAIWSRLNGLAKEWHCLVVTGTQAAITSARKRIQDRLDFSIDKRKYAHVTAMYGLNQSDQEKKIGVMRLNKLAVREDEFAVTDIITLLQRLQMGRPYLTCY